MTGIVIEAYYDTKILLKFHSIRLTEIFRFERCFALASFHVSI